MIKEGIIPSPLNWYGGKGGKVQRKLLKEIVNYINNSTQKRFIDVFGGSGIVAINVKKEFKVYNDINTNLYNFFCVLQDEEQYQKLVRKLTITSYSERIYREAQFRLVTVSDPIDKAYYFYIATMQSIDAVGAMNLKQNWSYSKNKSRRGMAQAVSRWLRNIDENLPDAIEAIRELQVTNRDAFECIDIFDGEDVIFYLDPPYIQGTRISKKVYNNEFTVDQHKELINRLIKIKGNAIVSGYDNHIYNKLLKYGWSTKEFEISTSSSPGNKNSARKEILWIKQNTNIA